jgi:hypothetical protein
MRRALAIVGQLALIGAAGCADSCQAADVSRPPASTDPAPGNVARGDTEPAPAPATTGTPAGIAGDPTGADPNVERTPNSERIGGTPGVANDQLLDDPSVELDPTGERLGTTPGIASDGLLSDPSVELDPTGERLGTTPGIADDPFDGTGAGAPAVRNPRRLSPLEVQTVVPETVAGAYVGYRLVPVPAPTPQVETEPEHSNYYIVESEGREWAISEAAVEGRASAE